MKIAGVGVSLPAYLRPADTARVIVLVTARQDEQELLPHERRLLAAGAEEARRLQLAKAVYHALILDYGGVGSAWSALSGQMGRVILGERLMGACAVSAPCEKGQEGKER